MPKTSVFFAQKPTVCMNMSTAETCKPRAYSVSLFSHQALDLRVKKEKKKKVQEIFMNKMNKYIKERKRSYECSVFVYNQQL